MQTDRQALAQQLIDIAKAANTLKLNVGKAGNMSVRFNDGLLITPSAVDYDRLLAHDMVYLDKEGQPEAGSRKPSTEWRFHHDILSTRTDVEAVIHLHPTYATALACLGEALPPVHYMIAMAGGNTIRCAPYHLFGTQALSDAVLSALEGRHACLMANHGLISCGKTLEDALALAAEIEHLCQIYLLARSAGNPVLLTEPQMAEVQKKFKSYRPD